MMSKIKTVCFSGINVIDVDVEVHFAKGQPGITIVGLGDKAVKESIDRIRASLSSIGVILPPQRITINLAPADIIKEGTHYDLPVMIGVLVCIGLIKQELVNNFLAIGELGLDGKLQPVKGSLPIAIRARKENFKGLIVPKANEKEAAVVNNLDVLSKR